MSLLATVMLMLLTALIWCSNLPVLAEALHDRTISTVLMQSGAEAVSGSAPTKLGQDATIVLDGDRIESGVDAATWVFPFADYSSVIADASASRTELFLDLAETAPVAARGRVEITIGADRGPAQHLTLSGADLSRRPGVILNRLVSLPALRIPLHLTILRDTRSLKISLTVAHLRLRIHRLGFIVSYSPQPDRRWAHPLPVALAAAAELLLLGLLTVWLARRAFELYGVTGVVAWFTILSLALVTADVWDFSIWLHLINIAAFGHVDPAHSWAGSPLWAWLLTALAPTAIVAQRLAFNPMCVTAALMKIALACSFGVIIVQCHAAFPHRAKAAVASVLPFALVVLCYGARDMLAAAFAVSGFLLTVRRRYATAALLFAAATSICEYDVALLALPLFAVFARREPPPVVRGAVLGLVVAAGCIVAEWCTQRGDSLARTLTTRLASVDFAEANPFHVVMAMGLGAGIDSRFVNLLLIGGYLFLVVLALVASCVMLMRSTDTGEQRFLRVVRLNVVPIAAFMLCYRGVDPQEWFGFLIVLMMANLVEGVSNASLALTTAYCVLASYSVAGMSQYWLADPRLGSIFAERIGTTSACILGVCAFILTALVDAFRTRRFRSAGVTAILFSSASCALLSSRFLMADVAALTALMTWLLGIVTSEDAPFASSRAWRSPFAWIVVAIPVLAWYWNAMTLSAVPVPALASGVTIAVLLPLAGRWARPIPLKG